MEYVRGADIGWYPQMLKSGFVFRNARGEEQNLLVTLKEYGINSIRLRTWVNPSDDPYAGHCSASEVLALAQECQAAGYRIMIDFHYGDSWCDGGKQPMPKAWEGLNREELVAELGRYTQEVMQLLKDGGVEPEWVQIGNETNLGMVLPMGSTDDWAYLTRLYNAGYDAVKAVCPQTKTMIQLGEITPTDFVIDYFTHLEKHGCRYDMMGFSFYPYHLNNNYTTTYEEAVEAYRRSMKMIPARFGKEMMIVEIGADARDEEGSWRLMVDAIEEIRKQPLCTGLWWWEPQGAMIWSDYPLSAWHDDGTPGKAMEAFLLLK